MSGTPENQQPPAPQQDAPPRKRWPVALDVALDCLLFILLQYMVSCVTLSFWMHPPRLAAIFVQFGLYAKFYHDMDKRLGKFWPGLVLSVVCVGVVVALVGLVATSLWGRRRCACPGMADTAESFTL